MPPSPVRFPGHEDEVERLYAGYDLRDSLMAGYIARPSARRTCSLGIPLRSAFRHWARLAG